MPRAIWGTPQPASAVNYTDDEPRGIFDILGGRPDMGEEIADRSGVIAQLLINLGGGRGTAGIAEAMSGVAERSKARREGRRDKAMVDRMADKLEPSNPEMAMMMRGNTKFGMAMLGKQLEDEWTSKSDLAKINEEFRLKGINEQTLEAQKQAAKEKQARLLMQGAGLTVSQPDPIIPASAETGGAAVTATPLSIGGTDSPVTAPTGGQPAVTPPPDATGQAPADNIPHEYYIGLPPGPAGQELLNQRIMHHDPEISLSEVTAYRQALTSENETGRQKYFDNIKARTDRQARVAAFDTRTNQVMRDNQALPGINLQQPGQPELMQAGINPNDPSVVPPNQVAQAGQYLRQAVTTSPEAYTTALKDIMQPPSTGLEVSFGADGKVTSISQGGKSKKSPTEGEGKALVYYDQAVAALPEINSAEGTGALATPSMDVFTAMVAPNGLATILNSDQFSTATRASLAFVEAVVRFKSGAQITPIELAMNYQIYIPEAGEINKPKTLALKRRLREKAARAIGANRSAAAITEDGYDDLNKAMETGDIEPGEKIVPPMPPWAVQAKVTPEQWAAGNADLWFPSDQQKKEE